MMKASIGLIMISLIIICESKPEYDGDTPVYYCFKKEHCPDEQHCISFRCVCKPKYVKSGNYCFPEAGYNDICFVKEQCIDHRLNCNEVSNNTKRCTCDRYHEYVHSLNQCAPLKNLTDVIRKNLNFREQDIFQEITNGNFGDGKIILIAGIAGSVILTIGLSYCFVIYCRDIILVKKVQSIANKMNVPLKIETADRQFGTNDASIGPILIDGVIIG